MGAFEPRPGRHELYDPARATDARARSCGAKRWPVGGLHRRSGGVADGPRGRTEMNRNWVPWSLLGAWLTAVVLVVPAGAEDFSLARCLVTGSGSNSGLSSAPQRIGVERHLACYEAQREHTVRRQAEEAAERERQRGAAEATRQQAEEDQAKETADETAEKRRARRAEERERAQ